MARYRPASGIEAKAQPGSHGRVLANRVGICSVREMDLAEYQALVRAQQAYALRITAETRFTSQLIRQMHADWLGELYEWAGCYRSVELEKAGFQWPPAHLVPANMDRLERELPWTCTPCRPASAGTVAHRLAQVLAELLLIHPFREGNGRLARWLADLMALQAGLPVPRYRFSGRGSRERREEYLHAVQRGYLGDTSPFARFFLDAIERALKG